MRFLQVQNLPKLTVAGALTVLPHTSSWISARAPRERDLGREEYEREGGRDWDELAVRAEEG